MGRCKQEQGCTNYPWCSVTGQCFKAQAAAPVIKATKNGKKRYYCSFCGKSDLEVRCMVDSDIAVICCECVELVAEIIKNHRDPGEVEYASWFPSEKGK